MNNKEIIETLKKLKEETKGDGFRYLCFTPTIKKLGCNFLLTSGLSKTWEGMGYNATHAWAIGNKDTGGRPYHEFYMDEKRRCIDLLIEKLKKS